MNTAQHTVAIGQQLSKLNHALRSTYKPDVQSAKAAAASIRMHLDKLVEMLDVK